MSKEIGVYTETMAKVYAVQGHWGKAAEIYRHLLSETPTRKDLADALAEAEKKILDDYTLANFVTLDYIQLSLTNKL